jgi:alkylation response protein AidB-like acyl-CoA dehydrogenase
MDLEFDDAQQSLRESFRQYLRRACGTGVVRAAEPLGYDAELWRGLNDMEAVGMAAPEDSGGGATLLDLAIVSAECGRVMAPVPFVESVVATRLLGRCGGPVASPWLDRQVAGSAIVTIALHAPVAGVCRLVPAAAVADAAIVYDGDVLRLVDAPPESRQLVGNLADLPLADLPLGESVVLADGARAAELYAQARREWRALTATALVGLAQAAHERTTDFVQVRTAFGVQIASFQSVAHKLASLITVIEGARLLAFKAAWAADAVGTDHDRFPALATMSLTNATEVARQTTSGGLHLHGGLGFTREHDIQLFLRRAKGWPLVLADPQRLYQDLADDLYGPRRAQAS